MTRHPSHLSSGTASPRAAAMPHHQTRPRHDAMNRHATRPHAMNSTHLAFKTALTIALLLAASLAPEAAASPSRSLAHATPLRLEPAASPSPTSPPATADDLRAAAVVVSRLPSTAPVGGPVNFTWPIDQASDDLVARPAPHSAASTGHARTVDPAALRSGVTLAISSPAAFFKLSPAAREIRVTTPDGRTLRPGAGLNPVGPADDLAFTLDRDLGTGKFLLRAEADAPVRLDILERDSDLVLLIQAARDVVFVGDSLRVEARLLHRGRPVAAEQQSARLVDPDGRALTRRLTAQADGSYRVDLPVQAPAQAEPDARLWTIEVELAATIADRPVRRSATTAVAVSVPTARLTGLAHVDHHRDGLRAELELEVASDSRYAVTAVLHGRNRDGQLQPIAVGQSAAPLTPGRRHLTLAFAAATIAASGMRGPFELHDLRLVDQGRMFVLHRQARALVDRSDH